MRNRKPFIAAAAILMLSAVGPVWADDSPAAGDLIKGGGPAVYYLTPDKLRLPFPDEATYFSWYQDFSAVKTISDDELAKYELGSLVTMRPGLGLIKTPSSPKVYAVGHGGVLCWITTETMAKTIFGDDWSSRVTVIPEAFFTAYQTGIDITAGGQYWWKQEQDSSPTIASDRNSSLAPENLRVVEPAQVAPPPTEPEEQPQEEPAAVIRQNVLYVLFDTQRPTDAATSKDALDRVLFGQAPSLADYYAEESNGRLEIEKAGVLGWYKADKALVSYWSDDETDHFDDGFKTGQAERIAEALTKADAEFDFSAYDADGNGQLTTAELAIFVVTPQTFSDPDNDLVTPYSSELPSATPFVADGVTITKASELFIGSPLGEKPQFGTMLHSFAALALGLTDYSVGEQDKYSIGSFSLMSNHYSDLRLDPYNRINLGWADPTVIPKAKEISEQHLGSGTPDREIIRIDRDQPGGPAFGSEYFLIENRERGIYDDSLPDIGIAIWDVNGTGVKLLRLDPSLPVNDANALWRVRSGGFSAPTGLELYWASDGARSGVQLMNVGYAYAVMDFTLSKKILDEYSVRTPDSPIQ